MINRILIILLVLPFTLVGQGREIEWKKINAQDSIQLSKAWILFLAFLERKDNKLIRENSLKDVSCDLCLDPSLDVRNSIVSIDTFINQANKSFISSPLYKAIKKHGVKYYSSTIFDYRPSNVPDVDSKGLTLFEVWIRTYVKDEWVKGHEGQSHVFQFVKLNNDFKFYGLSSIP